MKARMRGKYRRHSYRCKTTRREQSIRVKKYKILLCRSDKQIICNPCRAIQREQS